MSKEKILHFIKKRRNRLLAGAVLLFFVVMMVMSFVGCSMDLSGSSYVTHVYVDEETGVNYIWINSSSGLGIVPRYNKDGFLYVSK